jgi:hypothetical protein
MVCVPHVITMTDQDLIQEEVNKYLDSMPLLSRVTYDDLIHYVHRKIHHAFNSKATKGEVSKVCHSILPQRSDFDIVRKRGLCKMRS